MTNGINTTQPKTSPGLTVGVLIDSVDSFFNQRSISNLIDAAEEHDIRLVFFLGGYIDHNDPGNGLYSYAYTLPSVDSIQALIVFPHSIAPFSPYASTRKILERFPDIPVYSFFCNLPDFYSVWANEKTAIVEMISHLLQDHSYTKFALLCGPDSPESVSRNRRLTIEEALDKKGITVDPALILYGTFNVEDGKNAASRILTIESDSPEVLICFNDQMAIGAVREFMNNGISVPEDIAIIGFDDVEENSSLSCTFTTINFPIWEMLNTIVTRIRSDLTGQTEYRSEKHEFTAQFMHRESCGCTISFDQKIQNETSFKPLDQRRSSHGSLRRIALLRRSLEETVEKCIEENNTGPFTEFIHQTIKLLARSGDLTNSFIDTFSTQWTITLLRHKEFNAQVLINTLFVDAFRLLIQTKMKAFSQIHANDLGSIAFHKSCNALLSQKISVHNALRGVGSNLPQLGINRCLIVFLCPESPDQGELRLSYKEGQYIEIPEANFIRFPLTELINTGLHSFHEPIAVLPIAHGTSVYGYLILSISDKQFDQFSMIQELISLLIDSAMINNLLSTHIQTLTQNNDTLSRLTILDEFTGLFNRRALYITGQPMYQNAINRNEPSCFIFFDMDGLKFINDTYGHSEGDAAILALAGVLKKSFRDNDLVVRYGGDEFVVLMTNIHQSALQKALARIADEITAFNATNTHSWKLSASWGYVYNEAGSPAKSFETIIEESDAKLYEEKRKKKGDAQ